MDAGALVDAFGRAASLRSGVGRNQITVAVDVKHTAEHVEIWLEGLRKLLATVVLGLQRTPENYQYLLAEMRRSLEDFDPYCHASIGEQAFKVMQSVWIDLAPNLEILASVRPESEHLFQRVKCYLSGLVGYWNSISENPAEPTFEYPLFIKGEDVYERYKELKTEATCKPNFIGNRGREYKLTRTTPIPNVGHALPTLSVFANTWHNEMVSLRNRVLMLTPKYSPDNQYKSVYLQVRERVLALVGTLRPWPMAKVVRHMVQRHGAAQYGKVGASLQAKPINKSDGRLKMFLKAEKALREPGTPLKTPRGIQFRGPRYNASLGQYILPFEEAFYSVFSKQNKYGMYTSKGLSPNNRAALIAKLFYQQPGCVAFCVDASRFDAHVTEDMLRQEHSFYLGSFMRSRMLKRLLEMQVHNKGTGAFGTKYSQVGGRASGDLNTALGNTLINFLVLSNCVRDVPNATFVCEGDDAIIFVSRRFALGLDDIIKDRALALGFSLKCKISTALCDVEYCSGTVLDHGGGVYSHLRAWPKPLVSDCYTVQAADKTIEREQHALAVSYGAKYTYAGQPVYSVFAEYLASHARPVKLVLSRLDWWSREVIKKARRDETTSEVTLTARTNFALSTGISPQQQIEIEQRIRQQFGKYR